MSDLWEALVNAAELTKSLFAAKRDIDEALAAYEQAIHVDAEYDRVAKIAKSSAYLSSSGTAGERTAYVDQATSEVQYKARLAEGLKRSASQAVESRRQWLSALQSLASLTKAEAQLATWTPREVESA
jgi:hypothetical protein